MGDFNKMSEDEEDLEALRLAALQSLKKKSQTNDINQYKSKNKNNNCFNERIKNRRGKFFRSNQNRNLRNGQSNNWNRNSNLIAVPVISNEVNKNIDENNSDDDGGVNSKKRLILPQDRYCKNTKLDDDNSENINSPLSKFDRYDNSDRSDSESDDDDDDNDGILKRSNSLEALMEELENEINGETKKVDEKLKDDKIKTKKKKQITTTITSATTTATVTTTSATVTTSAVVATTSSTITTTSTTMATAPTVSSPTKTTVAKENLKPDSNSRKTNILQKKNFHNKNKKWQSKNIRRQNFLLKQQKEFLPPIIQQQQPGNILLQQFVAPVPPQFPIYNQQYDNLYQQQSPMPPTIFEQQQHFPLELPPRVPIYDQQQQISPLHINTDSFTAATTTTSPIMAPLSPRSAAFVLENRAIIEKRKRRSYSPNSSQSSRSRSRSRSLSLSPRYRRSKSRSPLIKKRQYSSKSPVRRVLPSSTTTTKNIKSSTIHERLGNKTDNKTTTKEGYDNDDNNKKKFDDPVMEARRRKFESNQLRMKEGVIRLKAKTENDNLVKDVEEIKNNEGKIEIKQENNNNSIADNNNVENNNDDEIDEDALLEDTPDDDLEINSKFDVLFSDEESNSDNEGRFKIKQQQQKHQQQNDKKIVVMPFTKLINGTKTNLETKLKDGDKKNDTLISNNNNNNNKNSGNKNERRKRRSKSPNKQQSTSTSSITQTSPKKIALKMKKIDKSIKTINHFPIDNKKIEIKIRNPAKYEENVDKNKDNGRKVEIMGTDTTTTVVNENINENKELATGKICEGDLRTQLSRKRAERQKQPLPDVVPSRLLQNALQSVGFDKGKKIKIDKNDNKDGKLPIRLRLGTATSSGNNTDGFGKKIRKRGNLEQV